MTTLTVRPAEGRRVRHPETGELLAGPVALPRDTWLIRRLADGDLEAVAGDPDPAPAGQAGARNRSR